MIHEENARSAENHDFLRNGAKIEEFKRPFPPRRFYHMGKEQYTIVWPEFTNYFNLRRCLARSIMEGSENIQHNL